VTTAPLRGEVWLADLDPTRGHEQAGRRPVLIVSEDVFNSGPADVVVVVPITSAIRGVPSHVVVTPPEGGLRARSAILCEAIRSTSKRRLVGRWGSVRSRTMVVVEDILRILLRL